MNPTETPEPRTLAVQVLLRTQGWSRDQCERYVAELTAPEVAGFARLQADPHCGPHVNRLVNHVADRRTLEEQLELDEEHAAAAASDEPTELAAE